MNATAYVRTDDIKAAVRGHEGDVLKALGVPWPPENRADHITCPYPEHGGVNDWRWEQRSRKAFCSCTKFDSILDVVAKVKALSFEDAKLRLAEILNRSDLVRTSGGRPKGPWQDAASLLNPPPEQRQDSLVAAYLGFRLGCEPDAVPVPSTPAVGWASLPYFDGDRKGEPLGAYPCVVFGTIRADKRTHAHRIYVAPGGLGKADLPDGRDPKKSAAKLNKSDNLSGCSALWGDPEVAAHLYVAEGVETACAVAQSYRPEIERGEIAVASALSTAGIKAFQPYPATRRITIACDRDEDPGTKGRASRAGERAARDLARRLKESHPDIMVDWALPGVAGTSVDWLDIVRQHGTEAVRAGLAAAVTSADDEPEGELEAIARAYPVPPMETIRLDYQRARNGEVWLHKITGAGDDVKATPVATPFGVPARLRTLDRRRACGLRVVVQDLDGLPREIDLLRGMLGLPGGSEIKRVLFDHGLRTEGDGDDIAVKSLRAAKPEREIQIVQAPGWQDLDGADAPLFVCPDGAVLGAPDGVELELSEALRIAPAMARRGSLEGWKAAAATALSVRNCPHWGLGIAAGFAGVLVSFLREKTCGFNLSGLTTAGKTTALELAASCWSTPEIGTGYGGGLMQSARATVNAAESVASRGNGTNVIMDELGHVSGKDLGKLIYMLATGTGKARMKADASLRESYVWASYALTSSETALKEKILSDGEAWTGGQTVRILDIDVTGVDRTVSRATMDRIEAVERHYGWAGPAFVAAFIAGGGHCQAGELRTAIDDVARELAGDNADSALLRAAWPLAVLQVAGMLAIDFGLLPAETDMAHIVKWAWTRFTGSSGAQSLKPAEQAIANLRLWAAVNFDITIIPASTEKPPVQPKGSYGDPPKPAPEPRPLRPAEAFYNKELIFVPAENLCRVAGNVLTEREIARALKGGGYIKGKDATHSTVDFIPGRGWIKAYALLRSEFGRNDHDAEPKPDSSETSTASLKSVKGGRS